MSMLDPTVNASITATKANAKKNYLGKELRSK
jgi:hypothetical protein